MYVNMCFLSLCILKKIIVKSEAFISCVPSFVVYFYVLLAVESFWIYYFTSYVFNIRRKVKFYSKKVFRVLRFVAQSFQALRLTLLDIFRVYFSCAPRVCVGIYNLINLSVFAYELLCDIVKEAITPFCFSVCRFFSRLKMSQNRE